MFTTAIEFFQNGGFYMYPIAFVLALGIAIAIERFIVLTRERVRNRQIWQDLQPALNAGDFRKAHEIATRSQAALGRMVAYGLTRVGAGRRAEDIELALEEGLMEILPRLEKRTGYLGMFANIATLLGLLGTIIGLISAFAAVANANPAEKANLLSQSIAVAMNTTAFGLIAAIPLLILFSYLQSRTTEIVDSLEMAAVKFTNMIRKVQMEREVAQTAQAARQPAGTAPRA
ncbi:MotA/TolQ/ExbB proton channel family protein [Permianibacter aggregans]|uniref:Outer membrane transport energization protein ExbB n=1 Tax=Permianibacter aggregans TaxID=1510150 RepID=A0A4R6UKI1_9GAMM|nr:MotA/TolQ/ExbB proton channel family protein [Permianibacter aggregans]QGX41219.1 MotA/TolQ/ExbB proton channel family protein [Permianibacter aggregans]TDQ45823.1 outer membrane transport energization protein ExbB [Permianibacter aggregans]